MKKSLFLLALAMLISTSYQTAIAEDYYFRAKAATIGTNGSAEGININLPAIEEGTTNHSYVITTQPSATGGSLPYVWSVTGDSELGINSSTGELTGTPTSAGLKTVNIVATDSQGKKGTTTIQVQVYDVLNISGPTFGSMSVGQPVNVTQQPIGIGGNLTYTWELANNPSWLAINSVNGHLTGTPTANGPFSFDLTVNDTANHSYTKSVSASVVQLPIVSAVSNGITAFTVGDSYNQQFNINASPAGMTYITGNIPEGTSLNANDSSATVSGTLSQTGNYTYQVNTTNSNGTGISSDINVNVYEQLLLSGFSIDNAVVGNSYNVISNPVATGGNGNYTYSILSQAEGAGLNINSSTGALSGVPTTLGNKDVVVKVVDDNGREKTVSNNVTVYGQLVLNNPVFGNSTALTPVVMTSQPSVTGGTGTNTWSLSGNPSWMTIDASTGVISGTPDTVGDFTVRIRVTSGTQTKTSAVISGTVQTPTLTLNDIALAGKYVNEEIYQDFKQLLTTQNIYDENAIVWSATNLPTGLTINSSNGVVSGTVTTAGTYNFNIIATFTVNDVDYIGTNNYEIVIASNKNIVSISAGNESVCALNTNGGVQCWGNNSYGQLGNNSVETSFLTPVQVVGLTSGIQNISVGMYHACAVTTSGGVKCWGNNSSGQLGNGTKLNSNIPVDVTGLTNVVSVSAGSYHTCALTTEGAVKCWGQGTSGQLGNGLGTDSKTYVNVINLTSGISKIESGAYFSCALSTSHGVKCWGNNNSGQLGNGTKTQSLIPVDTTGLTSGVFDLNVGNDYVCVVAVKALLSVNNGVVCWGYNLNGQLGDNSLTNKTTAVLNSFGLMSNVSSVYAGIYHTCAILNDGTQKCWGDNTFGRLGNGTTINSIVPTNVTVLSTNVSMFANGNAFSCVLLTNGGVQCWGYNNTGQLGNGTTTSSLEAVDVILN